MRILLPLALLAALGACDGGKRDSQPPGMMTNILDQALPDGKDEPPPPDNAIVPVEPLPDIPPPEEKAVSDTVPSALQGRWAGTGETCGDRSAALELTVAPDRLVFHESEGKVTAVEARDDGHVRVTADFTGEGESWTRTLDMKPSADGRRLTIVNDGTSVTRKRCGR